MITDKNFRSRWHTYYSRKRIGHQWFQVDLLKELPVQKILEIGPFLGLVTAMLASAGYEVTTLDVEEASHNIGAKTSIKGDIANISSDRLKGFDVVICCEMLEHIAWPEVDNVVNRIAQSGTPWLILSVPYEGFQFGFSLYFNRFQFRRSSFFRKLRFLKKFRVQGNPDTWEPHKWEIGYHKYSLSAFCSKVAAAGYEIERQEFTTGCRSVFLVCKNISSEANNSKP